MIAYEHLRVIMTSHKCSLVLMSFLWVNRYIGLTILKAKKIWRKKIEKNVHFEKKQALHMAGKHQEEHPYYGFVIKTFSL